MHSIICISKNTDLAYVIYTSGSTGKPKGVLIQHNNLISLMETTRNNFDFNQHDVCTLFHSFAFDFSVWEMWGALLYGGKLIIVPKQVAQDSQLFLKLLMQEKVTILNQTPSAFEQLSLLAYEQNNILTSLRYVIFGGEVLSAHHLKMWLKQYSLTRPKLINMYGITEITVHASFYEISLADEVEKNINIKIGKPLDDAEFYLLDQHQCLVPYGIAGELYIGGVGVARGYLNRAELTSERFISNPFNPSVRLYKTGDLLKYVVNNHLEYLGRIDNQVKLRGFRIELNEIEMVMLQISWIKQVKIVLHEDLSIGQKILIAYLIPTMKIEIEKESELIKEIKLYLTQYLPDYMLPNAYVFLKNFALNINGKIDHDALPPPEQAKFIAKNYTPPRSISEEQMIRIWMELLHLEKMGVHDNFFELGGHSLLAVQLIAKINSVFSKNLTVVNLFTHATVAELVKLMNAEYLDVAPNPLLTINKRAKSKPVFLVHPSSGLAFSYLPFREYLPEHKIIGVSNPRFGRKEQAYTSIEAMAIDYVAIIRKFFPDGPYILGGWSSGGIVAYEMARYLKTLGEEVNFVIMFDAHSSETFADQVMTEEDLRLDLFEEGINPDTPAGNYFKIEVAHTWDLIQSYRTQPYDGHVIMFKSQQCHPPQSIDQLYNGWSKHLTKPLEIYSIPGSHGKIFFQQNISSWAPKLAAVLDRGTVNFDLQDEHISFLDRTLMHAIVNHDIHLLQWVLQLGANKNSVNRNGLTALDYAHKLNNMEISKILTSELVNIEVD